MTGMIKNLANAAIAMLFGLVALTMASCEKEPGKGGLASISGKVFGLDYNSNGVLHDSGYVGDVRVYISYGGGTVADDDTRSSYTGEYSFKGLQKGKYKLWVFSECPSCNFNIEPIVQEVEITETRQEAYLPDFVVID